jgi:hypothetical protein
VLTVLGPRARYCDGLSRRAFLRVGAACGLTLPGLLAAEGRAGVRRGHKAVIMVYLSGGMSHQDTFDPKPDAPAEARGEFKPIPTNVPGVRFGEMLPRLARCMDKLVVIRSLVGQRDEHSSFQSYTGTTMDAARRDGRPHFGSVVARVQGPTDPVVPAFVDLSPTMQHKPYNTPGPALLGRSAAAAKVDGDELGVMRDLCVTADRLADRRGLLDRLDAMRERADTHHDRAFDVLSTSKLVDALDVRKEPERVRERYGRGSPKHQGDGAPQWNDQFLMARRLVEAGARVVTLAHGFWDTHGGHYPHMRRNLPLFDQGVSALVEDVYNRGLDRDVTVCVWGEFGRTPKMNKDAGRDHWARVNFALLAGGGMRTGQVIGGTDNVAGEAKVDPVPYPSVLATVYRNLGIDPHDMVTDVSGRPTPILPGGAAPIDRVY